jgi:hypothetical protein
MDDYALVLRLDLSDSAPEGPGWYIYATQTVDGKGQILLTPERVSGRQAISIAVTMQQGLTPGSTSMSPTQIVGTGNAKVVERLNEQIAQAEAAARRIGQLRRTLQTETEQQGE